MIKGNTNGAGRRIGTVGGVCLAIMLATTVSPSFAQEDADFLDPLAQIRAQVEQVETGATEDKAALASVGASTDAAAESETPAVKDPLARIAERFGLPVLGLVALVGLALLALLLGLMWLVTRWRARRHTKHMDPELYAVDDGTRGRRTLPSGTLAKREQGSKSTDYGKIETPSAAAAAAAIISDDTEDKQIDLADTEIPTTDTHDHRVATETATASAAATDANDPASWRQPNLDRLKDSIREDWKDDKQDKVAKAADTVAAQNEVAQNEAADRDLPAYGVGDEADSYFSEGLGKKRENEKSIFSDLRSDIKKTAADVTSVDTLKKRREETPSRDEAVRRIKALRDSLKAS